jgi:hypothetical protein
MRWPNGTHAACGPPRPGTSCSPVLLSIALARYPHQFAWGSASGTGYLIFLATMLLTGSVGLAPGLPHAARRSTPDRQPQT